MQRHGYLGVFALVIIAAAGQLYSQSSDGEPAGESRIMREKLDISRGLISALAQQNYGDLQQRADALADLARSAAWDAKRSRSYQRSSVEFERAAYQLAAAAESKNLDSVSLAYFNVTYACINCHESLRDANLPSGKKLAFKASDVNGADQEEFNFWMKKKLQLSEVALTALCVNDFESLEAAAAEMKKLSKIEGWVRRNKAQQYRAALREFDQANDQLLRAASDESADSAALALTNLSLSCVHCHQQLLGRPTTTVNPNSKQ